MKKEILHPFVVEILQNATNITIEDYAKLMNNGRAYHNIQHVNDMVSFAIKVQFELSESLVLAILFHDIYPNVEDSVKKFEEVINTHRARRIRLDIDEISEAIRETDYFNKEIKSELGYKLVLCDLEFLHTTDISDVIKYEKRIFSEYQTTPLHVYISNRIAFLKKFKKRMLEQKKFWEYSTFEYYRNYFEKNVTMVESIVKNKQYKVGLYCGSFNPFHRGHYDILKQAEAVMDKVIVCIGNNSSKMVSIVPWDKKGLKREIIKYNESIIDLYNSQKYVGAVADVYIIRGIRNSSDLAYETNFMRTIKDLDPEIKFIHFLGNPKLSHISSSMIREVSRYHEEAAKKFYKLT